MSRLIDADDLKEQLAIWEDYDELFVGGIRKHIDDAPTIEPQKIGHWNHNAYEWKAKCSECGEPCATYIMGKPRDRFCKWCGARMTEGREDATD